MPRDAELWEKLTQVMKWGLGLVVIPPAIILAIGAALAWAISGFRNQR